MFIVGESIQLFVQPLVWAAVMNMAQERSITRGSLKTIYLLLGLLLVVTVTFWLFHGPARVMECTNAFNARIQYREFLLKGVMTQPMEWQQKNHSGEVIDKIEKGASALSAFAEDSFQVIYGVVQLVGAYCMLAYYSLPAAYIVLVMMCITAWITIRFDTLLVQQYDKLYDAENLVAEKVNDALGNITTVIILRVERLVFNAITQKMHEPYELYRDNCKLNEYKWFLTNMCCTITTVVVVGVYLWQNANTPNGVLAGDIYIVVEYLKRISDQFFTFTGLYGGIVQKRTKVANAEKLSKDFRDENFTNHVLPEHWQRIEVRNLSFSYESEAGGRSHLTSVSFVLLRGKRIAIIGRSGSGKTTFLNILRDLYHPQSCELLVDGKIIPEGFAGISRAIVLIPQLVQVFAATAMVNLTLGVEYLLSIVKRFVSRACFTDVIDGLPDGYNHRFAQGGEDMSGGQKQRLALARGLLASQETSIVLLDEPTSNQDPSTARQIYINLFDEYPDKTVISTVHNYDLLGLFDEVWLFDGGEIIAYGTWDELMQTSCIRIQMLLARHHVQGEKGS